MDQRQRNNIKADAHGDQIKMHVRDGLAIPSDLDVLAAAVRIPIDEIPVGMQEATRELQPQWSAQVDVDTVE